MLYEVITVGTGCIEGKNSLFRLYGRLDVRYGLPLNREADERFEVIIGLCRIGDEFGPYGRGEGRGPVMQIMDRRKGEVGQLIPRSRTPGSIPEP